MKRGEVCWADFEPAMGSAVRKTQDAPRVGQHEMNPAWPRINADKTTL